jgi:uncharacterized repeat protein (TIGR03847 family)
MEFIEPKRCIIGTIGLPGERTFFWQITDEALSVSLRMEKQQAAIIADELDDLLDELEIAGDPGRITGAIKDTEPLAMPVEDEYAVGGMGIFVEDSRIRIELSALSNDNNSDQQADLIIIYLTVNRVREFAARARAVVLAGRGSCPFCAMPLERAGHICARANGYRR